MANTSTRPYEAVMLFHPDLEIDIDGSIKKVADLITSNGGTVTSSDTWGKRKLAYEIAKNEYAVYVFMELALDPASIEKIQEQLNISKEVLRYLITNPVPKYDKPAEDKAADNKEDER